MNKMDAWWWVSVPYSVIFPLFVIVFRLKESIGHAATLFVLVSFLTTLSSGVWTFVTISRLTSHNTGLTWRKKVKLGFVLLSAFLWVALLVGPSE